jgi:hypothetical protein
MQKRYWHYLDYACAMLMIGCLLAILPTWGLFIVLAWAMFRLLQR